MQELKDNIGPLKKKRITFFLPVPVGWSAALKETTGQNTANEGDGGNAAGRYDSLT